MIQKSKNIWYRNQRIINYTTLNHSYIPGVCVSGIIFLHNTCCFYKTKVHLKKNKTALLSHFPPTILCFPMTFFIICNIQFKLLFSKQKFKLCIDLIFWLFAFIFKNITVTSPARLQMSRSVRSKISFSVSSSKPHSWKSWINNG